MQRFKSLRWNQCFRIGEWKKRNKVLTLKKVILCLKIYTNLLITGHFYWISLMPNAVRVHCTVLMNNVWLVFFLARLNMPVLKFICEVIDVERSGHKDDVVNRIMDFLLHPKSSGKGVPAPKKRSKPSYLFDFWKIPFVCRIFDLSVFYAFVVHCMLGYSWESTSQKIFTSGKIKWDISVPYWTCTSQSCLVFCVGCAPAVESENFCEYLTDTEKQHWPSV